MLKLPIRLTVTVLLKLSSGWAPSLPTVLTAGAMPAAVGVLADVAAHERGGRLAAQLSRQRLALVGLQVGDDDLRAALHQRAHRAFAQARCAAGDDENLVRDVHVLLLTLT
jgi:hypothetical protein